MRFPKYVNFKDVEKLQYEVIPQDLRVYLTRLMRDQITEWSTESAPTIVWQNMVVNLSRNLLEMPIYVLAADDLGDYSVPEQIWHEGEFDVALRRLDTVQFIEMVCELIKRSFFTVDDLNSLLERANIGFRIRNAKAGWWSGDRPSFELSVEVTDFEDISDPIEQTAHPNIRALVERMDSALERRDTPAVLHTSACIFETMAKDVLSDPSLENKSLGKFFDKYRKQSRLPDPILNYIREVFSRRNIEPLAGHGQTATPTISYEEAVILCHMTKAFIGIEYRLIREGVRLSDTEE